MVDELTHTLYVRHTFDDKELLGLSRKMAGAESKIREKQDSLKSVSSAIKAEIDESMAVLHNCAEKLRSGYEMRPRECLVTYDKNIIKYADKETGEILEEKPMTEDEQLRLAGHRVDAEDVIRQAREEEED